MDALLSDKEFEQFRKFLYDRAGIVLSPAKKPLVAGRLMKRLQALGLNTYDAYYRHIHGPQGADELQCAINLLTTNETYFFREPKHFQFLETDILPKHRPGRSFRVWSAASSSGEEAYSIAMLLAEYFGVDGAWEIMASDLSTRVLERAQSGLYPLERAQKIPQTLLSRYCLKGVGSQQGMFLIDRALRQKVQFRQINLVQTLPHTGEFDVIFLRNVMIYFDMETKYQVVQRLLARLRPGGHFFIGHSETLNGLGIALDGVMPAIYRKN